MPHHRSHSTESSSSDEECFEHTFYMQTEDTTFLVNDSPPAFPLKVTVRVSDGVVTIDIPTFSFTLPTDGFLFSIAGNLPEHLRHNKGMPSVYTLQPDADDYIYALYLANDGSIVIGYYEFLPLGDGQYNIFGTSFSYPLPCHKQHIPKNVKLAHKSANVVEVINNADDFLDFYNNDYYGKHIAYSWVSNPQKDLASPNNLNLYAAVGKVKDGKIKIKHSGLIFAPSGNVDPSTQKECFENCISINPTNPKNLVITSNFRDSGQVIPDPTFTRFRSVRSYTLNGGKSWTTDYINGNGSPFGLPNFRSDNNALFDIFGNYWLCYMTASTDDLNPPYELVFAISIDGGQTFTIAGTTTLNAYLDYPRLSFGGDGNGGYALWFSCDYVDQISLYVTNIIIGYIPISGFNTYGTLTYDFATGIGNDVETNSILYIQVPEITATPFGDVYLAGTLQLVNGDNGNNGKVVIYQHTGGINDFTSFTGPKDAFMTNVGGNDFETSALGKPVAFQPNRGVFPCGARGIDYDPINNLLWLCGTNIKPNVTDPDFNPDAEYHMSIFAMYSENQGNSWSEQIEISDTQNGPRGLPSIKVNQKNGNKAFFWYDSRESETGQAVKPYATLLN